MTTVLKAPIHALVVGMCGSAATFILLHCDRREGTPYSRYVIHSGTKHNLSIPINGNAVRHLEQLLSETKSVEEMITTMYMKKLNKTRDEVDQLISRGDQSYDAVMSPAEAISAGLITAVFDVKLDIFK